MVDSGNDHACALVDGAVFCWGHNDGGAGLGAGTSDSGSPVPLPVVGMDGGVDQVSMGGWGGCTLLDGAAWCWGLGGDGELGDGNDMTSNVPVPVAGMDAGVTWVRRDGGPVDGDAPCAVENGQLYCWGNNTAGRLGDGTTEAKSLPTPVDLPGSVDTCGGGLEHNCAVLLDGRVFCSGRGNRGQLGNGGTDDSAVPVEVVASWE
jgi:alpha-tubulin suppressor-like RCC1 family protein